MAGLKMAKCAVALFLLASAFHPHEAEAVQGKTGTLTVYYSSAGPSRPNGYENASVDVEYFVADCSGAIAMGVRRVRGSVKGSPRYWFEGQQLGSAMPEPDAPDVSFRVDVLDGGKVLKSLTFAASDQLGMGCFTAMTQVVGTFSQFLPKDATPADKEKFLKELFVSVIGSSPMILRNEAMEAHFRKAREQAAKAAPVPAQRGIPVTADFWGEKKPTAGTNDMAAKAPAQKNTAGSADFWHEKTPSGATMTNAAEKASTRNSQSGASSVDFWGDGPAPKRSGESKGLPATSAAERAEEARAEIERRNDETIRQIRSQQAAKLANIEKSHKEVDRRFDAASGVMAAGDSAAVARGNIQELSRMNPQYESAAALEQDYERRLSAIKAENQSFESAQQKGAVALREMYFGSGTANERAVGAVAGLIASAIANSEREAEVRRARQRLEAQREQGLRQLAAEQKAALLEMRRKLLDAFPEGRVPLSSERVAADMLFYFWYEVRGALDQTQPALTLGNVFPVQRRADGSWPFKQVVKDDIADGRNSPVVLVGHFVSRELAEKTRSTFVRLAGKSQFLLSSPDRGVQTRVPAGRESDTSNLWDTAPANAAKPESDDLWK